MEVTAYTVPKHDSGIYKDLSDVISQLQRIQSSPMTTVLCVGVAVLDFVFQLEELPTSAEKFVAESADMVGGGCAANASVSIARLGGHVVLGAQLGKDPIGDLILADLRAENVDIANVTRADGGRSSFSSIYMDRSGERQIVNFRGTGLSFETSWFEELDELGAVLTDTRHKRAAIDALNFASKRKIPGIVDGEAPIDPDILFAASHAAFSMQGLTSLYTDISSADALVRIAETYHCWACVTDGANGVLYKGLNGIERIPSIPIRPRDTLGAGDIWHGAFALSLAEGKDELGAIHFANAAAAYKCTKSGGREGAPTSVQLKNFLTENAV